MLPPFHECLASLALCWPRFLRPPLSLAVLLPLLRQFHSSATLAVVALSCDAILLLYPHHEKQCQARYAINKHAQPNPKNMESEQQDFGATETRRSIYSNQSSYVSTIATPPAKPHKSSPGLTF